MKRSSTKTDKGPSAASLREIPEVTLDRYRPLGRGRHVEKTRRSSVQLVLDRKVVEKLGGEENVRAILSALARAITPKKKSHRAA